jgi:caffeoyl-CoA O-methyltransferase
VSSRTLNLTDSLHAYLLDKGVHEHPQLKALREETSTLRAAMMQISPEQGSFMSLLVKLIGAKRTIEVGTFTGYSALAVALAMPDDSLTICCDVSDEWTSIGRKHWEQAGVANKIDLRLAPATETLQTLMDDGQAESFDFFFIDADKDNYDTYYEFALKLLMPGGLIAVDNVLWNGAVADPDAQDEMTTAIRAINDKIYADDRVDMTLLPIGDGLSLARKKT